MKEKTFREKTHIILCVNGCMSRKAVSILSGSEKYKGNRLYEFKLKGLIERRKGGLIRMTRDGLTNTWHDHIPEEYKQMAETTRTACIKASESEERRMLYHSEVLAMVLESGVGVWEKEGLPPQGEISYVGSKNMKKGYLGDKHVINQARAQGTLFGAGEKLLNIYVMGVGNLKWIYDSETRYKVWTENENQKRIGTMKEAECVIIIENTGNLQRFMGKKKQRGGAIQAGDVYKHIYALPKNITGSLLLGVLALGRGERKSEELAKEKGGANFLLPDLTVLRKIKMSDVKKVCCLEEMEAGVRSVVPDAEIITVSMDEFLGRVFL